MAKRGRSAKKSGASRQTSRKHGGSRRAPAKRRTGARARPARWLWRLKERLLVAGVGALFGLAAVLGILYRQAVGEVEDALSRGPSWSAPGRVLSGPLTVWPGLAITPEELGEDLRAAGYVQVDELEEPGDYKVTGDAVLVRTKAKKPGTVLVSFRGGRVKRISPRSRLTLGPIALATVSGPGAAAAKPVPLKEIPEVVRHAVLAMEDARFYEHRGLDPIGIARALLVNAVRGGAVEGGSTLTQQLVKNRFLSQERTYRRKAREALLAIALESRLSKDRILELYLDGVYLGHAGGEAIVGVDAAARTFFGKPVGRLDVGEAATIGGIISAPNRYSPLRHPDRARKRRDIALDRMVELGWLSPAEADAAKHAPLTVHAPPPRRRAPWLVDAAIDSVEDTIGAGGVAARAVTVRTDLDPELQRVAERAVSETFARLTQAHPELSEAEAALVAVRVSDGAVVALVGGRDYAHGSFDRALYGRRQAGSTVKPLSYLLLLDQHPEISPSTLVRDEAVELSTGDGRTWAPANHDHRFLGDVTLRQALADSRNIPAVKVAQRVGFDRLEAFWKKIGLSGATAHPSAALGAFDVSPLELAGAYTIFPGGGVQALPRLVREATDGKGKVLARFDPITLRRTSAAAAFLATTMLQEVLRTGTGAGVARYGLDPALFGGKTGTTDREHDAWFVGFDDTLVVAVWVGFDKGRDLGLYGSQAALPIWARFMADSGTASRPFPVPDGVEQATLCSESHLLATQGCPKTYREWFSRGEVPAEHCPIHGDLGDKLSNVGAGLRHAWERVRERFGATPKTPPRRLFNRKHRSEPTPEPTADP